MADGHTARERRYADIRTAAEYRACSEVTIRRDIARGRLSGYRIGRVIRVDLNEIDDLMDASRIPTAGGAA